MIRLEVVHRCPPEGSGVTPCCGRTPFELPYYDRMTLDSSLVTCAAEPRLPLGVNGEQPFPQCPTMLCSACHPSYPCRLFDCAVCGPSILRAIAADECQQQAAQLAWIATQHVFQCPVCGARLFVREFVARHHPELDDHVTNHCPGRMFR